MNGGRVDRFQPAMVHLIWLVIFAILAALAALGSPLSLLVLAVAFFCEFSISFCALPPLRSWLRLALVSNLVALLFVSDVAWHGGDTTLGFILWTLVTSLLTAWTYYHERSRGADSQGN
jgi:uncharacterized membrane protein